MKDAELNYGDRVKTGPDSRVEIRVYPSCYLTLAENTEIIYGSDDEGAAAIRVLKGSAILASQIQRKEGVAVSLLAGDSVIEISEPGFYRLNVQPKRESDVLVYDGKLIVDGTEIKRGQRAILFAPRLIVAHMFGEWTLMPLSCGAEKEVPCCSRQPTCRGGRSSRQHFRRVASR